ncbi:MAG: hypothetical protein HC782_02530 [Gammaproteobacteria bacterium]|nr:hypothetical protein [Gammaproteobacteria bacterium]
MENIDWDIFEKTLLGQLLAIIFIGINIVLRQHAVIVKAVVEPDCVVSFIDAKKMLCDSILANKNAYTHTTPQSLVRRINRAKSLRLAMESFGEINA